MAKATNRYPPTVFPPRINHSSLSLRVTASHGKFDYLFARVSSASCDCSTTMRSGL